MVIHCGGTAFPVENSAIVWPPSLLHSGFGTAAAYEAPTGCPMARSRLRSSAESRTGCGVPVAFRQPPAGPVPPSAGSSSAARARRTGGGRTGRKTPCLLVDGPHDDRAVTGGIEMRTLAGSALARKDVRAVLTIRSLLKPGRCDGACRSMVRRRMANAHVRLPASAPNLALAGRSAMANPAK